MTTARSLPLVTFQPARTPSPWVRPPASNDLRLDMIQAILLLSEHLHFRHAAAAAHMSPAGFSRKISHAEQIFGHVLFARSTRRVTLTPLGQRLLPRLHDMCASVDALWLELAVAEGESTRPDRRPQHEGADPENPARP